MRTSSTPLIASTVSVAKLTGTTINIAIALASSGLLLALTALSGTVGIVAPGVTSCTVFVEYSVQYSHSLRTVCFTEDSPPDANPVAGSLETVFIIPLAVTTVISPRGLLLAPSPYVVVEARAAGLTHVGPPVDDEVCPLSSHVRLSTGGRGISRMVVFSTPAAVMTVVCPRTMLTMR